MAPPRIPATELRDVLGRNLIFVGGKGGVGKTVVSRAIARMLSHQGKRVLWATFEDPTRLEGELKKLSPHLSELNCDAGKAFEEYAAMKIGAPRLARVFLQNKLIQYLAKAAPGIHELVLLGKVWFERTRYDHVVVDLPSTGYGLAMFQSAENFNRLFGGGPLHRDAAEMLATFNDPKASGFVVLALPEEMPLREALELDEFLRRLFPANPSAFLLNRAFPDGKAATAISEDPDLWPTPFAESILDYAHKRRLLEAYNLRLWQDLPYERLQFVSASEQDQTVALLTRHLETLRRPA